MMYYISLKKSSKMLFIDDVFETVTIPNYLSKYKNNWFTIRFRLGVIILYHHCGLLYKYHCGHAE